jgi:transposase
MPAPNAVWPELQPKAAALRRAGKTNTEIAEALGTSRTNIYYWIGPTPRALGGTPQHQYGLRDRAHYLRECGYEVREIADIMKIPKSTVGEWVRGMPCG